MDRRLTPSSSHPSSPHPTQVNNARPSSMQMVPPATPTSRVGGSIGSSPISPQQGHFPRCSDHNSPVQAMNIQSATPILPSIESFHLDHKPWGLNNGPQSPIATRSQEARVMDELRQELNSKALTLSKLQNEHNLARRGLGQLQSRCETLETKLRASDRETAALIEERNQLRQSQQKLEDQVGELSHDKEELEQRVASEGAQWRQIMAMSSQLQVQSAEEQRRYNADRERWEKDREQMRNLAQGQSFADLSQSELALEMVRLQTRCRELEHVLSQTRKESKQISRGLQVILNAQKRVATLYPGLQYMDDDDYDDDDDDDCNDGEDEGSGREEGQAMDKDIG